MTIPNYAAEGRIREACAAAGVRIECLEDVVGRFRAGQFNEADLDGKLAEWRAVPDHHFFSGTQADLDAEAVAAFGPERTLRRKRNFCEHGEAKAAEIAAQFGTALGGKPGKTPDVQAKKSERPECRFAKRQHQSLVRSRGIHQTGRDH